MNKAELIDKVSKKADIPANVTKVIVDSIFDSMRESMEKGDKIEIRGFGSFTVRKYSAYKGRNPKSGGSVSVPPKRLPHFKTGKDLREKVNKLEGQENQEHSVE